MFKVTVEDANPGELLDLDLADPTIWRQSPYPTGQERYVVGTWGEPDAGPLTSIFSDPPRVQPMPRSPGHGHGSDSWRISIKGTLSMGAKRYRAGEFRFQDGGVLYGPDDASWSEQGGQCVIVMGDRRGRDLIAADPRDQKSFDGLVALFNPWAGLEPAPADFNAPQGMVTSFGRKTRGGFVGGSFADDWPALLPGLAYMTGLLGDRVRGAAVLLAKANAGTTAFPAIRMSTDVMHVIVGGEGEQGGACLKQGSVRFVAENAEHPAIVAGNDGLWLASVVGDRRALASATLLDGTSDLLDAMQRSVADLQGKLVS